MDLVLCFQYGPVTSEWSSTVSAIDPDADGQDDDVAHQEDDEADDPGGAAEATNLGVGLAGVRGRAEAERGGVGRGVLQVTEGVHLENGLRFFFCRIALTSIKWGQSTS